MIPDKLPFDLQVGDQVLVGTNAFGNLINGDLEAEKPWQETFRATIIGLHGEWPLAYIEDCTKGHNGGYSYDSTIAPQYQNLPRTNQCWDLHLPNMFKKATPLSKPKAKKAPKSVAPTIPEVPAPLTLKDFKPGERVMIGRATVNSLMDSGRTLDPTLTAVEAMVLTDGATVGSGNFAIYVD